MTRTYAAVRYVEPIRLVQTVLVGTSVNAKKAFKERTVQSQFPWSVTMASVRTMEVALSMFQTIHYIVTVISAGKERTARRSTTLVNLTRASGTAHVCTPRM